MRKGALRTALLAILVAIVLTSCSSPDGASGSKGNEGITGSKENATEKAQGAKTGASDLLIYGRGADSASLDPMRVTDLESFKVTKNIYDTLVDYGPDDTSIVPALATKWDVSKDGLTYTFTLREGVTFHDGTAFNAEAVVKNFERWMNGERKKFPYYADMFGGFKGDKEHVIKEVKATGEYTVQFMLFRAQAPFLKNLGMPPFAIASPTAFTKDGDTYGQHPVGTGPFVFKEWRGNETITLERNEAYWDGAPKLHTLVFQVIPDNSARLNALKKGEIDVMDGLNPSDADGVAQENDLQLLLRPPMNVAYIGFNTKKEPFGNPKVRRALNHAVDKQAIIDAFYAGKAEPAKNPMPPAIEGYNDDIEPYAYDLDKAKQLLAEAGYENGFEMDLWVMSAPRDYIPEPQKVAEAVQADFAKIGVKAKLVTYEWASYTQKVREGEAHAYFLGWIGDNGDADNFIYVLLDPENVKMSTGYKNDKLHELLVAAQTETDEQKRNEMYKQAQVLIHEDTPWVPLAHGQAILAAKSNVKNFKPHPTGADKLTNVYVEE
ncbi:ABC transporter substrate-binding protein [Numidum massiliense]|uniref:ABC transporter substrate-binding protein n=1 Tax=Numidum massiliense TaxID=1522315 RepID=UPI0006D57013